MDNINLLVFNELFLVTFSKLSVEYTSITDISTDGCKGMETAEILSKLLLFNKAFVSFLIDRLGLSVTSNNTVNPKSNRPNLCNIQVFFSRIILYNCVEVNCSLQGISLIRWLTLLLIGSVITPRTKVSDKFLFWAHLQIPATHIL